MILDYKQLLIDYLTFWKQRDFRFLVENQHLQNKIISLKTKLLNLKFFEWIFELMKTANPNPEALKENEEEMKEEESKISMIDYFYNKSKKYEKIATLKREKENELRIRMFSEYSKFTKSKEHKGQVSPFDIKSNGKVVKEEHKKNEEEVNLNFNKDDYFIWNAWLHLHGKTLEDFERDRKQDELYFLEEYYSFSFWSQNINSIESKIVSFENQ